MGERERERESVSGHMCMCMYVYAIIYLKLTNHCEWKYVMNEVYYNIENEFQN